MLRRIDENAALGRLLAWVSTALAVNRGLPMMIGIVLVLISFIASGVVLLVIVNTPGIDSIWLLLCIPATLLHLGVFVGFLGFMLSTPLGSGYRE